MFTKAFLKEQLEQLEVPENAVVMLHSSLRAVGETEGRGQGLLEVLINHFTRGKGLLCFPTHTWGIKEDEEKIRLDLTKNETCVGMLTKLASAHPDSLRSLHPTHSVAVFGDRKMAEEYIYHDALATSSTDPAASYGKLYDCDGYVMLVGVGHNKNTYIHSVEEMLNVPNRLTKDPVKFKVRLADGTVVEHAIHCHSAEGIGDVSRFYVKYEPAFRKHGAIKDGMLGNAKVQLCSAKIMKDVVQLVRKRSGGAEILSDESPLNESWY